MPNSPVIVSTGSSFLTALMGHGNNLTSTFFSDFMRIFLPESSPSTASTSTIGSPLGEDSKSLPVTISKLLSAKTLV
jgi:hypothetical protein